MDIKEIAQLAGVSPATVSKVVNHKDSSISKETREKVNAIVEKYHYVPYSSIISRQSAKRTLAVILREPVSYDSMLDGIIRTAQREGYTPLVLDSYSNPQAEARNLRTILSSGCAGIIWEPVAESSQRLKTKLARSGVPFLLIGVHGGNGSLVQPYYEIAYQMTNELVSRGHTGIGCLLSKSRRSKEFLAGYRACLENNSLPYMGDLVFEDVDQRVARAIADGRVTGVVSSHFRDAIRFSQLMSKLHYHIPIDVSLVSLHNEDQDANDVMWGVQISTYIVRNSDFGVFLCKKLVSQIEGRSDKEIFSPQYELENTATVASPPIRRAEKVIVVGSLNSDTYMLVPSLPHEGAAVSTLATQQYAGGKAANVAAGIAKLGYRTAVLGNVGSDYEADVLFREFDSWGIESSGVHRVEDAETGKALIFADSRGNTMISLVAGANALLAPQDIRARISSFEGTRFCLVQTEIPLDTVVETCKVAHEVGACTVLKPSSCDELPKDLLPLVDYLIPNEHELERICKGNGTVAEKARYLLEQGPKAVIVTLGSSGCFLCTRKGERNYPAFVFPTVDDAGACDAFASALVASLLDDDDLDRAIRVASYAAGYSVTRHGVIPSLIDHFALVSAVEAGAISGSASSEQWKCASGFNGYASS